jgi:galacturan 1,4-alpha-galacturonidase
VFLQVFEDVFNKACQSEGSNVVLIPNGTYMLGPVMFSGPCKGPMTFFITGALIAHTDVASYVDRYSWITFYRIDRLVVRGGGSLDGQGPSAWGHNTCSKSKNCNPLPSVSVLDSTSQS